MSVDLIRERMELSREFAIERRNQILGKGKSVETSIEEEVIVVEEETNEVEDNGNTEE